MKKEISIKEAIDGVDAFFDGEWHSGITAIVDSSKVRGQRQEDECQPNFDHCYVDQGGGGFTGDDFHGYVYFYMGNDEYIKVEY